MRSFSVDENNNRMDGGDMGAAAKMTSVEQLHPLCWDAPRCAKAALMNRKHLHMLFSQGPWIKTCFLIFFLPHPTFGVIQAVSVEAEV